MDKEVVDVINRNLLRLSLLKLLFLLRTMLRYEALVRIPACVVLKIHIHRDSLTKLTARTSFPSINKRIFLWKERLVLVAFRIILVVHIDANRSASLR